MAWFAGSKGATPHVSRAKGAAWFQQAVFEVGPGLYGVTLTRQNYWLERFISASDQMIPSANLNQREGDISNKGRFLV
jgi:hypothetical protein